jgi:hypothetical protein
MLDKESMEMLRKPSVTVVKVFCSPEEKSRIQVEARKEHRSDSNYMLNLFLEASEKHNR